MKIAQVVSTYPPYRGGMGAVAFEYTERLRARGHNVHVYTTRMGEKPIDDPKYIHRIPATVQVGNAGVVPSLYKRMSGFDLVHLHYPFFGGAEPVVIRKALRNDQALVMTYHMDVVGQGLKGAIFNMHRKLLFPWIVERADRILVSSKEYAETSALQKFPNVLKKTTVLPFGVDTKTFFPGTEAGLRRKHGIDEKTPVLIFIGGLDRAHYFKGLPVLIKALKELKEESWYCLIIGSGDLQESFEAQAEAELGPCRMEFLGNVSEEDKPSYYRMANIHVFPSVDRSEAFGLVAVEAAASGIPSIASETPGVTSVVQDPQSGLFVTPNDAISLTTALQRLIRDPGLANAMGESARERAETIFAWPPLMDNLEKVYREVIEQRGKI